MLSTVSSTNDRLSDASKTSVVCQRAAEAITRTRGHEAVLSYTLSPSQTTAWLMRQRVLKTAWIWGLCEAEAAAAAVTGKAPLVSECQGQAWRVPRYSWPVSHVKGGTSRVYTWVTISPTHSSYLRNGSSTCQWEQEVLWKRLGNAGEQREVDSSTCNKIKK